MEIIEVDAKTFGEIIPEPFTVFGSAPFAELNSHKVDKVLYLLFREGKYRLGLTGGIQGNTFNSPFSAPYGGLTYINDSIKIPYIDSALQILTRWANESQFTEINITLPPSIYAESFISKQTNALYRAGYTLKKVDLNYSFPLQKFDNIYLKNIWGNARNKIQIALRQELQIKKCESIEEIQKAYDLIRLNREAKGYTLHMSWKDIMETIKLIPADVFLVCDYANKPLASSFVFNVSDEIVQIIYWGDIPDPSEIKTMNFLAYKLFEYYKKKGKKIIDLGPSTDKSIPNIGLGIFKESIGCEVQTKMQFQKHI